MSKKKNRSNQSSEKQKPSSKKEKKEFKETAEKLALDVWESPEISDDVINQIVSDHNLRNNMVSFPLDVLVNLRKELETLTRLIRSESSHSEKPKEDALYHYRSLVSLVANKQSPTPISDLIDDHKAIRIRMNECLSQVMIVNNLLNTSKESVENYCSTNKVEE